MDKCWIEHTESYDTALIALIDGYTICSLIRN